MITSPAMCRLVVPALLALAVAARAAEGPPTIARPAAASPAVIVTQDAGFFTLSNGIVTARINKRNGDLRSLVFRGIETMGSAQGRAGGYWEQDPSNTDKVGGLSQSITIDPTTNNGERAEVSIVGISKGDPTAGLTPGSPGAPAAGTINCDLELRYTLGRGDSGIYVYAIFTHPEGYGPLNVPESRYLTRISQAFDWLSVDADRNMLQCAPTDWGTGVVVHAKEQRIMTTGVYKNSVEHKYNYTGTMFDIPAYGWSSTKEKIGIFFINPTIEYIGGGASKQELVCHFGDNANPDPIILNYWRGTHFGGGATVNVAAGEKWSKVIGPMFVYVNALEDARSPSEADLATLAATHGNPTVPGAWKENATALWKDALEQANKENDKWPYDWVQGADYPKKHERGTVKGQLLLADPQAATTRLPNLTIGLAYPDGGSASRIQETLTPPPAPARGGFGRGPGAGAGPGGALAANRGGAPATRGRGGAGGLGGFVASEYIRDAKNYQFWVKGSDDGTFTIPKVRPGTYTLHAWADGVLGEFAQANIVVKAGDAIDLGKLTWKPVRLGRQIWEIGVPNRKASEFLKGDGQNYWLWGWPLRYALLFPNDLTYTIGKSTPGKDWFFSQVPHAENLSFVNPEARDPANQRFGWVKAESLQQYPQTDTQGPWRVYGRGRATTWTIKFTLDNPSRGTAAMRFALAGADGPGLTVSINGKEAGAVRPMSTNALRYNTDRGIWQQRTLPFDASLLKPGENEIQLTFPAGELTSGVVYDYLRLELDENTPFPPPASPVTVTPQAAQ